MSIEPSLLPSGFRDRLPPVAEALAESTAMILGLAKGRGYRLVTPPLVEYEESLGHWLERPLLGALFRSPDPATGAALALRPDLTRQVARIAATRLRDAPRPLRLCYAGPVVRGRADPLFPERERIQVGAELVGNDGEHALAEAIALAVEALTAAGVRGLAVDLATPDLVAALAAEKWPVADLGALQAALDRKDWGALAAKEQQPYRALLDIAGPLDRALPELERIAPELAARLALLARLLPDLAMTIDPTERHGFEYQSWLGFSIFGHRGAAGQRAEIGRGGSYFIHHPDGGREAAAGVSLYLDTLVDGEGDRNGAEKRLFLPFGTPAATAAALRARGWITIQALAPDEEPHHCTHRWDGKEAVRKG